MGTSSKKSKDQLGEEGSAPQEQTLLERFGPFILSYFFVWLIMFITAAGMIFDVVLPDKPTVQRPAPIQQPAPIEEPIKFEEGNGVMV